MDRERERELESCNEIQWKCNNAFPDWQELKETATGMRAQVQIVWDVSMYKYK